MLVERRDNLALLEGGVPQIAASAHIFRSSNHFSEEFQSAISYLSLVAATAPAASLTDFTNADVVQGRRHER